MRLFQPKMLRFYCMAGLIIFPSISFSEARVIVKNFCDQTVALHASGDMVCEPSGIDVARKRRTRIREVNSGIVDVCNPLIDDGQGTYFVQVDLDQQDESQTLLSPETSDLPQDGELIWYCSNSGSTGPCECSINK